MRQEQIRTLLLIAIAALAAGCTTTAGPGSTPYTAEAIRLGNPPGTRLVFEIREGEEPPIRQTMRFISGDSEGCELEQSVHDASGAPLGETTLSTPTWTDLRNHALFPAALTRRTQARCTVAAGSFDCWLYTVAGEGETAGTISRFYFAPDRAGPPVLYDATRDGEVVFRMELVEDSR